MSKGIVYFANGERFVKEAANSAKCLKDLNQKYPVCLFSNQLDFKDSAIDEVRESRATNPCAGKIQAMIQSPYSQTIFFDTDTKMRIECLDMLFDLLDKFDLLLSHAPAREGGKHQPEIPICFPEFNTGVIAYNDGLKSIFRIWETYFHELGVPNNDQPAFRKTLYEQDVKLYVLPHEFNLRPWSRTENDQKTYIVHDRLVHSSED